jgi:hypothetical protein
MREEEAVPIITISRESLNGGTALAECGSVRLAGAVECNELHEDIIYIAQTVPGVQEVISALEVRPIFPYAEL